MRQADRVRIPDAIGESRHPRGLLREPGMFCVARMWRPSATASYVNEPLIDHPNRALTQLSTVRSS